MRTILSLAMAACAAAAPLVAFSVAKALGSNMVLQRAPQAAVVWGFAMPSASVKTTFNGKQYTSTAGSDTIWRQTLPPTAAGGPFNISFEASTGETGALANVLFGDVYLCSGFSVGGLTNSTAEIQLANNYPDIRIFNVGEGNSSTVPLDNLASVAQPWSVASNRTIGGFSAVCWLFGRDVHDGLGGAVPMGLVASDWGGTPIEHWADPTAYKRCNRNDTDSTLYNAMINPFVVGPMTLSGFTWYQGESNTGSQASADAYACLFPSMIQSWRALFGLAPDTYFGFIQLSTWCDGDAIPIMRDAQMAALALPGVGYGTNADHGAGCNIHPPPKQHCSARLANSALALAYKQPVSWRSPTYASATATAAAATVSLNDVTPGGLVLLPPANAGTINCTNTTGQCAWGALQFDDAGRTWVNATVGLSADRQRIVLSAAPPAGSTAVVATSYGWGAVPFITVYRADADLPVLGWIRNVTASEAA